MRSKSEEVKVHTFASIKGKLETLLERHDTSEFREARREMRQTYALYQYNEARDKIVSFTSFAQSHPDSPLSPEFNKFYSRLKGAISAIEERNSMTPALALLDTGTDFRAKNEGVIVALTAMRDFQKRFCTQPRLSEQPTAEQDFWSRRGTGRTADAEFERTIRTIDLLLENPGKLPEVSVKTFIDRFNRRVTAVNTKLGYSDAIKVRSPRARREVSSVAANDYLESLEQARTETRTRSFLPWLKKAWYDAVLPLATEDMRERPDYMHYLFGQTGSNEDIGGFEFFAQAREGFKVITVFATALIKRVPRFLLFNLPAEMFNYFKGANAPDAKMRGFSIMSIPETLFRGAGFLFDALVSPAVSVIRIMRFLRENNIPFFGRKDVQDTGASLLSVAFVAGFAASVALIPLIGYWALASIGIGFALLTDMPLLAFVDLDNAEAPVSNSLEGVSESVSEAIAITDSDNNNSREPVFSKVLGNGSPSPKVTDDVPATSSSLTPAASN